MILARAGAFGGLLIALAVGRPLGAQDRATLELGASVVQFPQDSAVVAGPSARWFLSRERGRMAMSSALSGLVSAQGASAYVELSSRWLVPLSRGWSAELGGEGDGLVATGSQVSPNRSSTVLASVRLVRPIDAGGVWGRGTGSVSGREAGALWGRGIDVGGWWRQRGVQLVATIDREWSVAQLFTGPDREGFVGVVPVRYTEASVGILIEGERASLAMSGLARRDPGAERLIEPGLSATAAFWASPNRAILLSAARQLPDFVRRADAANSITLSIRLNDPSPAATRVARARPILQLVDVDSLASAAAAAGAAGDAPRRALRVRAPSARRVEIMGDFTGWEPVELTAAGEVFTGTFALSTGSHRLALRLDGGAWIPAANTPAIDDDFGGRVGLLVVP